MGDGFGLYRSQPPGGKCQPIKMTFHKRENCLIYCHTKTRLTLSKLNLFQHPQFPLGGASTPDQCNCVQVTDAPAHLVLRVISSDTSFSSGSASVDAASQWWERVSAVTHTLSHWATQAAGGDVGPLPSIRTLQNTLNHLCCLLNC